MDRIRRGSANGLVWHGIGNWDAVGEREGRRYLWGIHMYTMMEATEVDMQK